MSASPGALPHAGGPAIPVGQPVPQVGTQYDIKRSSADVPATTGLFHHIYSPGAVSLLPQIIAQCRKKRDIILNGKADAVRGLSSKNKQHIRKQVIDFAARPDVEKANHLHALVEGYLITDPHHHCLQHNQRKLQGVDVRVNGERGLRAKQNLLAYQLLGAYNGEVLVQREYDDQLEYDFALGDNVRDDKTFTLWPPDELGDDPSKELVIVGRLACNPLALVNDPTGSGHEPNVFAVMAWSQFTEEVNMYYIVKKEGVQKGQELWLDYGPSFRRHILHDEPARLASILKLKRDVKALEDQREALRAELQEATLTHEGDTTEIRGLQAYVKECQERTSELQSAQIREADSCQTAKAQLQQERADWRSERKEWCGWNEELKAQLLKEEKKRLTERNVAIFQIAEAASAQRAAEDRVERMKIEVDTLRAAHDAPHRLLQDATSALHGQLDALSAQLRGTKRQLAQANTALEDAQRDRDAEMSERVHLAREVRVTDAQLQSLEADYKQLRAASRGEAGTRAAADHARAEAAAHAAAAEVRQLKAMLAAQSADLKAAHKQRADDARRLATAAAENSVLRGTCARKDAALKSADAAAHQAASQVARFMQRDAQVGNRADQQPSMPACGDSNLSASEEGTSSEDPYEEQTCSEGHAEPGQALASQYQLQVVGGMASEEPEEPGSHADKTQAASPKVVADQPTSMQAMLEHDGNLLAGRDTSQQTQMEGSSCLETETSKRGAMRRHAVRVELGLASSVEQSAEEPDQHDSRRGGRNKGRSGYNRGRHAHWSAHPARNSEMRVTMRRSSASIFCSTSRSSTSRSRDSYRERCPRERSGRGLQRSPSSRHRHSPLISPPGRRNNSPRKERHSRHSGASRSAKQEQHGHTRHHHSQSPAGHHRSDCSRAHSGRVTLPSWGYGQLVGPGQRGDSMTPRNSLGRELVSPDMHAVNFVKQEQAEQGTGCVEGETQEDRFRNAMVADPAALGMRCWKPRKKTAAQKRADKREYERSFQISSLVTRRYKDALENADMQADAV